MKRISAWAWTIALFTGIAATMCSQQGFAFISCDPNDISADGDSHTGRFYTLNGTVPHLGNLPACTRWVELQPRLSSRPLREDRFERFDANEAFW